MSPTEPQSRTESLARSLPEPPLDTVPAPAYSCDASGRITAFNERAAGLWGRRPKLNHLEDRYCGAYALLDPDGERLPHEACPTALALATGRAQEGVVLTILRPDGRHRTVLHQAAPQHDTSGRVVAATTLMIDVTEHEAEEAAARRALEASEANFRGFFESVAVGAAQVNAEGRFVRVNDRYCEITGYSRAELLRIGPFDLDHPDDREADIERVRAALADPAGVYHTEKRYIRKDGTICWVHVAVNFVRAPDRRVLQSAAVVMDITERKRAEQALQEADRRKDEFLATLAHELRNPLAPLRNAAEVLRQGDGQGDDWCRDVIDRQITHLARLIDDLLDVSKITRDRLELRKTRVALGEVLAGAIEASRPLLDGCQQTLEQALPAEPVYLHGDPVRLTQVFTNLLTNAAKFTHWPGRVRVSAVEDGTSVEIRVADDGIGIAADELGRVFDKFYQSPNRGGRVFEGLGIGLALVRRIVELHGGRIEARSAGLGHGSEFVVRLPLARADARPAEPTAPAVGRPVPRRQRILVVDDHADGADTLCRLLSLMGHDAATAYDGQSALQRAATFQPDVIFLDLGMPGMDGFDVCRHLRETTTASWPRVIALTGWGRRQDVVRTRDLGFDAHLVKPVDRVALERVLYGPEEPDSDAAA